MNTDTEADDGQIGVASLLSIVAPASAPPYAQRSGPMAKESRLSSWPTPISQSVRPNLGQLDFHEPGMGLEQAAQACGIEVSRLVKLNSNECCYGPPPLALKAIRAECKRLSVYPAGIYEPLVQKIAEMDGVDSHNVIIGPGAESIIRYIATLFIERGDESIVAHESFDAAPWWTLVMGGTARYVGLRDYRFDLDGILSAITNRTKVIWLCSPNNPTGSIIYRNELSEFLQRVPSSVAVVMDQAYQEFVDHPDYADGKAFLASGFDNVIVLRSLSKAWGLAGLRLGYALMHDDLARLAEQVHEPFHVSREAARAGLAALSDDRWMKCCVSKLHRQRGWLTRQITELGLTAPPSQANFILIDTGRPARAVAENMLRHGVAVRPTEQWGYPYHVRITVGNRQQCQQAIRALSAAVAEVDAAARSEPAPTQGHQPSTG
jgi:histidinol-phosphate aminotransferase